VVRKNIQLLKSGDNHFRGAADAAAILTIVLDRAAREPLAQQLYRQLRDHILARRLGPGARLPSTRRISEDLGVSRTVPLSAYDQLSAEGYVEPRRGSGLYVGAVGSVDRADNRTARSISSETPRPTLAGRPFDPSAPGEDLFPVGLWTKLMARGWRREGAAIVGQSHPAGLPSLRAAIAHHLYVLRGVSCDAGQIVVTAGNTDALQLIAQALRPSSEKLPAVWVEDPGYLSAGATLAREGLRVVPVPVDGEGLDVEAGVRLAPRAVFALVTPARQFPLGMPMSLGRRIALINWARETGAVLIEDDYDSEVRFSGRPLASLQSLDPHRSVLSIGSFSKLTFSGLRLGYIAGPEPLIQQLIAARERQGAPVAMSAQPALQLFMEEGGFARHLRGLRRQITRRRLILTEALHERLGDELVILPQEVGMHFTVLLDPKLRPKLSDTKIAQQAARHGLNLDPLSAHSITSPGRQGFLLGYAGWSREVIEAGVETLARLVTPRAGER
jgi:GntR family transcriptional regulator/MocR family aminotransferase